MLKLNGQNQIKFVGTKLPTLISIKTEKGWLIFKFEVPKNKEICLYKMLPEVLKIKYKQRGNQNNCIFKYNRDDLWKCRKSF